MLVSFKDEEFEELYNQFSGEKGSLEETKEIWSDDFNSTELNLSEMDEKDILLITVPEKELPSLIDRLVVRKELL